MIERSFTSVQVRANKPEKRSGQPSPGELTGYASVYNSLSENLGGFRERVASTAFTKSLRDGADVRALVNHDASSIVGRTTNRTLRLSSDAKGLRMECTLPDTSCGRDLYASVLRGDLSQMSFAFQVEEGAIHGTKNKI